MSLDTEQLARARGFKNAHAWKQQNRKAYNEFARKAKSRKISALESNRYDRLARQCESEYFTYGLHAY